MLSTPPFSLASSTSIWQAAWRSGSCPRISAMRSSATMPVRPSQQTRQTSPGSRSQGAGDDVLVLEVLDLFFRQAAGADQLVEQRMIPRRRVQLAAPPDVAA